MDAALTPTLTPTPATPPGVAVDTRGDPLQEGPAEALLQLANSPGREVIRLPGLSRLHSGLSIVVDDVDEIQEHRTATPVTPGSEHDLQFLGNNNNIAASPEQPPPPLARHPSNASIGEDGGATTPTFTVTDTGSPVSSKERCGLRVRQIQGEAENRKSEFARLLEEHAQVVARLKAMEGAGQLAAATAAAAAVSGPTHV